ncbi:MAG: Gfo/Idh/MocA family oxidoreductase [Thermotogae bacterium]|nr:Gfo/Idh/MocA family oxidoreductase [Thermotogota bacterium]
MKGVFYRIAKREVVVEEVPPPSPRSGRVLIKVLYSAISTGTEGHTVALVKNPLKIVQERGREILKLLSLSKDYGFNFVLTKVKSRAYALSPLGYSVFGVVLEDSGPFRKGEAVVAIGGEYAYHMEVVSVPHNLAVKVSREDKGRELAFGAIASIGLHAIRQSGVQPGERALVIGLGVVGQIVLRLLRVWDVEAVGMDIDPFRRDVAAKEGFPTPTVVEENAYDVVFVAAPDSTGKVINLAGKAARDRGKVVALASANYGFQWKDFYYKELSILISRSYGPGRYDPLYEELGHEYPIGYVRWSEGRNLRYVVRLIEEDKLNLRNVITHEFPVEEAPKAYALVTERKEPFVGVVLKYGGQPDLKRVYVSKIPRKTKGTLGVAFIGAGSYAQGFILPILKRRKDIQFVAVATSQGHTAKSVASLWNFPIYTTDYREILKMEEVDLVFVMTRHSSHASIVTEALEHGKAVYCEKPLAINVKDLDVLKDILNEKGGFLMVGFNRRFSSHTVTLRSALKRPFQMLYRIDAGSLPKNHWIYREGGRLLGEGIHFVDYAIYLGGLPTSWDVQTSGDGGVINLAWADGSVATILYSTFGSKPEGKERIEVMSGGTTIIISDFRHTMVDKRSFKTKTADKGQKAMIDALLGGLREGKPPIDYNEIFRGHEILLESDQAPLK